MYFIFSNVVQLAQLMKNSKGKRMTDAKFDFVQEHQKLIKLIQTFSDVLDETRKEIPENHPNNVFFEELSLLSKHFLEIFKLMEKDEYARFLSEFHSDYQKNVVQYKDNAAINQVYFLTENLMRDPKYQNLFVAYGQDIARTYEFGPINEIFDKFKVIMKSLLVLGGLSLIPLIILAPGFSWLPFAIVAGVFLVGAFIAAGAAFIVHQNAKKHIENHLKPFTTQMDAAQETAKKLCDDELLEDVLLKKEKRFTANNPNKTLTFFHMREFLESVQPSGSSISAQLNQKLSFK